MAVPLNLRLGQRQRLTFGHPNLPFDQIQPRHCFGDRMLDLQARIHLQKIEIVGGIQQKFDRASIGVANRATRCDCRRAHRRS